MALRFQLSNNLWGQVGGLRVLGCSQTHHHQEETLKHNRVCIDCKYGASSESSGKSFSHTLSKSHLLNVSEGEVCFHFLQLVILNVFFWNREKEQFSFCLGRREEIMFPAQGPFPGSPRTSRLPGSTASVKHLRVI